MTALPSACVLEATLKPRRPSMIIRQGMTDTGLVNLDAKSAKEVFSIQRSALSLLAATHRLGLPPLPGVHRLAALLLHQVVKRTFHLRGVEHARHSKKLPGVSAGQVKITLTVGLGYLSTSIFTTFTSLQHLQHSHILTTCFSSLPTYLLATNTPIAKEARASSASKGRGEAVCGRPCAL